MASHDLGRLPAEQFELSVRRPVRDLCVVRVAGELDMLTAPVLEGRLGEVLRGAPRFLVLDLEPLGFIGSRGLGALLEARALAASVGTDLHLAGLSNRVVDRVLQMTQLVRIFQTHSSVADACTACVGEGMVTQP